MGQQRRELELLVVFQLAGNAVLAITFLRMDILGIRLKKVLIDPSSSNFVAIVEESPRKHILTI